MTLDHNASLRERDPVVARLIDRELRRQQSRARADRQRELRLPRRARGDGHAAHQQVRRGLSRASATTAAARSSTRSSSSRSTAQAAVRRRARQRAAALRARRRTSRRSWPLMQPGDTFLGMDLSHGGHLTHGSPVNLAACLYKAVYYGVDRRRPHRLRPGARAGARSSPKLIIAGDSAYSADHRLRGVPRDRRRGRRDLHGGHGALRRTRRRRRVSRRPCRTPTSSRPRRTRRCAARAAG